MGNLQHVYVTAHGSFASGAFVGESAQMGVRLAIAAAADEPAKGTTFDLFESGEVVIDAGTSAGTNGTLTRTWSARLGPLGNTENADAAWQIDLAEDFRTFLDAIKSYQGPQWRWTHVKIAPILADGKYGAPAATYQFTTPIAGGGSNQNAPEVALAMSFRAPVLGRRGRGRFYIPALSTSTGLVAGDGVVVTAAATAILTAGATLVTNLENSPGTEVWGPIVCVTSAGSSTAVRPTQLRIGNHFDVQRRRQLQVAETYTVQAL